VDLSRRAPVQTPRLFDGHGSYAAGKSSADYGSGAAKSKYSGCDVRDFRAPRQQCVDGIGFDRLVTPDELRALDSGFGDHWFAYRHARGHDDAERADAARELRESRAQLAAILGHDIRMFCFPYGAYNDALDSTMHEAGYERVFTCMPRSPILRSSCRAGCASIRPTGRSSFI